MEYTFTFTEQEANAILNAIQELPAKVANPLTQKIRDQAQQQQQAIQPVEVAQQ
jgi:predicted DNA-binding transcriptional regulator YafY